MYVSVHIYLKGIFINNIFFDHGIKSGFKPVLTSAFCFPFDCNRFHLLPVSGTLMKHMQQEEDSFFKLIDLYLISYLMRLHSKGMKIEKETENGSWI